MVEQKSVKKSAAARKKSTKSAAKAKKPAEKIVSDYNGYDYKKIFWEDVDRQYEDLADHLAVRRLLPEKMQSIVDVGGAYGRLTNEYIDRAEKSTIFDYSKTELKQAKEQFGDKVATQAGDVYKMPFKDEEFDALLMVRVTHHLDKLPKAVAEFYRVLKPGGVAVIEVANKRTLPKMFRYWLKKSDVNPFDRQPSNLKGLNVDGFYNYHPKYAEEVFQNAGFEIEKVLSVSNFRSTRLKQTFGAKALIALEKPAQKLLAPLRFAPSIYYRLRKPSK